MAQNNNQTGTNPAPRLVVKIVGSKQVKEFIEEPQKQTSQEAERRPADSEEENFWKAPEKQEVMKSRSERLNRDGSGLWTVISQVPDRVCVTAPSGDRSRSYIHPKSRHMWSEGRAAEVLDSTAQTGEDGDKAELSSAVREQLSDWSLSALRSIEEQASALHPSSSSSSSSSSCGTLKRSEVTHLFLKNDVPLKLPTFSLLLQMFSDKDDPDQIDYRNLLQFIRSASSQPE